MQTRATPASGARKPADRKPARAAPDWLFALALVAATLLAYQPAWHAGFIWDDDVYVTHNPLLTAPDGLRRIWFSLESPSQYFPLTYTAFYLEHVLWGLNQAGYHWVNILLHAANALLVWRLLARLRVPGAWLAAAVFALHPVQVESVAWVTELKNVLMSFFFLLALLAWIKFVDETEPWRFYLLTLICYALALAAKTTACTLPAALLLILWLKKMSIGWRRLAQVAPFVALGIGMGLVTVWWERFHQFTQGKSFSIGMVDRALIASRALWFYAGKLLWPVNLCFSYPHWTVSASDPAAYCWALATLALGVVIWRARRWTGRSVEVAALFFAVTLSPVLGFIMLYTFRYTFVADHYQYLACLGPIALASAAVGQGMSRWAARKPFFQPALCGALLLVLGVMTWRQCGLYADSETLWRATLARNPESWIAHDNLGAALGDKGEVEQAMAQYRLGLAINPDNMNAHNNLGMNLALTGKVDDAIAEYHKALEINPNFAEAHYNLAAAFARKGQIDDAIAEYRQALAIKSGYVDALNNLGVALVQKGDLDVAIAQYRKALEIAPDYAKARKNLGNALLRKGDFDAAMACYEKTAALSQDPLERWYSLGNDFLHYGELVEAVACYRQAIKIRPQFADGYANLGVALFQKKETKDAIDSWQKALALNPALLSARNNLAWLLATASDASLRDGAQAVTLAEKSNLLTGGGNPVILHTLAAAYAEAGRFAEATTTARHALDLALAQKNSALAGQLQKEITLYEARVALHE